MYQKRIRKDAMSLLDEMESGARIDLDMFSFVHMVEYSGVRRALLVTPQGVMRSWLLGKSWCRWQPIDLPYREALAQLTLAPPPHSLGSSDSPEVDQQLHLSTNPEPNVETTPAA